MPTLLLVPKGWVKTGCYSHVPSNSQSQIIAQDLSGSAAATAGINYVTTEAKCKSHADLAANKRKLPLAPERSSSESKIKNTKQSYIDLNGVPAQPLILKNGLSRSTKYQDNTRRRPVKEGSSKYTGVYRDRNNFKSKMWKAQIMVVGTVRSIGYYATEEAAAADYARAAFKYKPKKVPVCGLDLTLVPEQPLIRSENNSTGYKGVKKMKGRFQANLVTEKGKAPTTFGTFDTAEEAAGVYARAVYCLDQRRKIMSPRKCDQGKRVE